MSKTYTAKDIRDFCEITGDNPAPLAGTTTPDDWTFFFDDEEYGVKVESESFDVEDFTIITRYGDPDVDWEALFQWSDESGIFAAMADAATKQAADNCPYGQKEKPMAPKYAITAEHEYGDPDYHCATLTVGEMTWSHTVGDFDLGPNTLTYRQAIAAEIIDDPDDVDEDDLDDVISDRGAFTASVREEIETAAIRAEDDYDDAEIEAVADEAAEDIDEYAKFLWWSPRGFANECILYGIKSDEVDAAEAWLDDQDPAQSKWEWMDAEEAHEELRDGTENAVNLRRGFGVDNPPCGVTEITPWSDAHA